MTRSEFSLRLKVTSAENMGNSVQAFNLSKQACFRFFFQPASFTNWNFKLMHICQACQGVRNSPGKNKSIIY